MGLAAVKAKMSPKSSNGCQEGASAGKRAEAKCGAPKTGTQFQYRGGSSMQKGRSGKK